MATGVRGWTLSIALVLCLIGCLQSSATVCSDGRICPAGTRCALTLQRCVSDEQLTACASAGLGEGEGCQATGVIDGVCIDGNADGACTDCVCIDSACGDGYRVASEICDGTDLGARPTCNDHGYYEGGNVLCSASCSYDPSPCTRTCGDGTLDADHGEICDGAAPLQSCVDFGYDAGRAECIPAGCSPLFETCRQLGWEPVVLADHFLEAIAMSGDEVFVIGSRSTPGVYDAIVYHRVGGAWTRHATGLAVAPESAWTPGGGVVYGVGRGLPDVSTTRLLKFDANGASTTVLAGPGTVWGTGATDVWVFAGSSLMRGDGTTWSTTSVPNLERAVSVWGSGPNDVWVVSSGTSKRLLHYNGAAWSEITMPFAPNAVWGAGVGDVFVAGAGGVVRRNGAGWINLGLAGPLSTIGGRGANWVVATASQAAYHFNGQRWAQIGAAEDVTGLRAIIVANDELLAVVGAKALRYAGGDWGVVGSSQAMSAPVTSIHGTGADDVFVVEDRIGVHRVKALTATFAALPNVIAVGGNANHVYAVGSNAAGSAGVAWKLNGTIWQPDAAVAESLRDVAVSASGVAFAVSGFAIYQRSGTQWTQVLDHAPSSILSIWCDAVVDRCVAVGDGIFEWDGSDWAIVSTDDLLWDVWGASHENVWVVGLGGRLRHRDATGWSSVSIPGETSTFTSVSGSGPSDVFLASNGLIYHYDGVRFSPVRPHTQEPFASLWASPESVWLGTMTARAYRLELTDGW